MRKTLIAGAGTIGRLIASLLVNSGDYEVFLVDNNLAHLNFLEHTHLHLDQLDVTVQKQLVDYLCANQIEIVISSLPYAYNLFVAEAASSLDLYYFDLTEDVAVAAEVKRLAAGKKAAFVSQCGVAPGFINIVAQHLMSQFGKITATYLRAGCLPKSAHNALQYAITWSLDGLINEYGNTCFGLVNGQKVALEPLSDLEMIELDGALYEAFNTSGGAGSLVDTYQNQIKTLNYKTLRYPGHCEKMRFLMQDLQLNSDRRVLKEILEKSIPRTDQDIMLVYVSVIGEKGGQAFEQNYVKKIEPSEINGQKWSAIQTATASSLCTVVDLILDHPEKYQGYVQQEAISYDDFINNRFGKIYKTFQ